MNVDGHWLQSQPVQPQPTQRFENDSPCSKIPPYVRRRLSIKRHFSGEWLMLPIAAKVCLCVFATTLVVGCKSSVVGEAVRADSEGRVISNELMADMYPNSFRSGSPPYLERDFEAGANFICDQIKIEYRRDICSEPKLHWR